jgi:predicted secreted protein
MVNGQNEGSNGLPDLTVGEVFTVFRENNRSTGYEWRLVRLQKFALIDMEFRYENEAHSQGSPGRTTWVLQAIEKGQGEIQFAKYRTFEPEALLYEDVLPYTIGPKLPIPLEPGPVIPQGNALSQKPGGWSEFKPVTEGSEAAEIFEKTRPALGIHYKPLLYSQQVVNGSNYIFLADAEIVGGQRWYAVSLRAFVKDENVTRLGIKNIGQPSGADTFGEFVKFEEGSDAGKALKSAFARHAGLDFKPLYVARQKVAGDNYLFAGNGKAVVQHPTISPMIVKVYQPLEGPARIINIEDAVEL